MRILKENNYILECWKCNTKIIYTYKDCFYDSRYYSYELCCPNCHNRYSSTRNELFGKKYKENECNSDKEIERLNNIINELENILIKQIEEDKDTQNNKILFMRQEDKHILNTIKELKGSDK